MNELRERREDYERLSEKIDALKVITYTSSYPYRGKNTRNDNIRLLFSELIPRGVVPVGGFARGTIQN